MRGWDVGIFSRDTLARTSSRTQRINGVFAFFAYGRKGGKAKAELIRVAKLTFSQRWPDRGSHKNFYTPLARFICLYATHTHHTNISYYTRMRADFPSTIMSFFIAFSIACFGRRRAQKAHARSRIPN